MEHARKMVLVPQENIDRMQHQQGGTVLNSHAQHVLSQLVEQRPTVQTPGDAPARLDAEMAAILNSSTNKNAHEKWKLYQDVLRRYLFYTGKKEEEPPAAPETQTSTDKYPYTTDMIISGVSKKFRPEAGRLLQHIQSATGGTRLHWDSTGIVRIDGVTIPGSNIIDLMNDALRHRQTIKATGRELFAQFLRDINAPREFVQNRSFWTSTPLREASATATPASPRIDTTPVRSGGRRRNTRASRPALGANIIETPTGITSWQKLT